MIGVVAVKPNMKFIYFKMDFGMNKRPKLRMSMTDLLRRGYVNDALSVKKDVVMTSINTSEIRVKPETPSNIRVNTWSDDEIMQIPSKFLRAYENLGEYDQETIDYIRVFNDKGRLFILNKEDTFKVIEELGEISDFNKLLVKYRNKYGI